MLRVFVCLVSCTALGGCASTIGTLGFATGEWPLHTSTSERRDWLDGQPVESLVVEAHLDTPPRALCERRRHEPASLVVTDHSGVDAGGRIAMGFIGVSELALAAALAFVPRADGHGECGAGCDATAVFFGLDGFATVLLAIFMPDHHYHHETRWPDQEVIDQTCPADVAFVAAGHAFPVLPDGSLTPADAQSLMNAVVETGSLVTLRFAHEERLTAVPREVRCDWAIQLGNPIAPAVCARAP